MSARENIVLLLRMRDAALCLGANNPLKLSRIELQKAVYLADALTVLFELLAPLDGHQTYRHGPFDMNLQNAMDSLAFRGLVAISGHQYVAAGHQCRYHLTEAGVSWARTLSDEYIDLSMTHTLVASNVKRLGWSRVVKLAYAEPMFLSMRQRGYGGVLQHSSVNGLSSSRFISIISRALGRSPRPDVVAKTFFDFLDNYARGEWAI